MSELAVLDERAGTALAFRYTPTELRQWVAHLDEMRRAILQDGTDYSVIPGTQKPTLLKPGAEKLLMAAGLGFTIERIPEPGTDARQGVTYRTTIRRGDDIVAQCDGYAGYDEDRFYQASAPRRIEAERRERSNAAKYQRAVNSKKWEDLPEEDYRAPWNSVMKMAEKRSLVGAVLNALAASGLFTQDLEDMPDGGDLSWDVGELLRPWLQEVYKVDGAREELRDWTSSNNYPERPKDFNQTQATALLVHIGTILARRQQTSAVEGGDHPSPPTTAEEVSTPPGSESAPQSRDEDGVEHVARDGGSNPTVAATPSAPDLMEALEASLAAVKGAQEEEDPLVVGSERTPSSPVQSALGEGSEVTRLGDEIVAQMDGMEGPAVPEGSVSYEFARRQVAGHAAETNPSKTQPEAFELADLALKRFPVGPISREDLRSALRAVEPAQEGEEDPFGPTKSQLEERAKDLAETSRRRRPEPRQMGLVD